MPSEGPAGGPRPESPEPDDTRRDTGALFEPLFSSPTVLAATSDAAWLAAMLRFEGELALAEADVGLVPPEAAAAIAEVAASLDIPAGSLDAGARAAGNPVVPLVRTLTAAVGDHGPDGRRHAAWVHFGATSQDTLDTAAMLVAKEAGRAILADLGAAADAGASLARAHRSSVMAARTLLQQALPTTFGLRAARWLVGLVEAAAALDRAVGGRLAVQLGGAAGTLASFGDRGLEVAAHLAARLGLEDPVLPWHTDRCRLGELGAALSAVAGACGKVALDVVLLAQTEVAEVAEGGGAGHGGSSTLPHKANPATSVTVLGAARRAHAAAGALAQAGVQDHERAGTGGWHAEWPLLTDLLRAAGGCAAGARHVLEGLSVDPVRMARNLEATHGVLLAERVTLDLAPDLGREEAAAVVAAASRRALAGGHTLRSELGGTPEVAERRSPQALDALCDATGYLGANDVLIDRALDLHARHARGPHGGQEGR